MYLFDSRNSRCGNRCRPISCRSNLRKGWWSCRSAGFPGRTSCRGKYGTGDRRSGSARRPSRTTWILFYPVGHNRPCCVIILVCWYSGGNTNRAPCRSREGVATASLLWLSGKISYKVVVHLSYAAKISKKTLFERLLYDFDWYLKASDWSLKEVLKMWKYLCIRISDKRNLSSYECCALLYI